MNEPSSTPPAGAVVRCDSLADWFACEAGAAIASQEAAVAAELLPDLFGYHLLQLGRPYGAPLLVASRIGHQVICDDKLHHPSVQLGARADALPLQPASVDVVVLPHGLEFESDPHGVLREIERVLIPEGYLLTFSFNPWSLYGLWRVATGWRGDFPWRGRFIPFGRLQEWLAVRGVETVRSAGLSFRPPLQRSATAQRFEWVERLGRHFLPFLGNVYWLLARKRVPAARPIRALRARRPRMRSAAVVESGSRRLFDSVKDPNDG
jgi:SAM-dependent methyltransferase